MKRLRPALLLLVGMMVGLPATAQERVAGELQLKAALIRNILMFVQWPTPAPAPLLCLFEGSPLLPSLSVPEGDAQRKPLTLRQVTDNPEEWRQCQAIWVDGERVAALGRLALAARQHAILLIGEGGMVLERGAMISLAVEGGRMVLDVDQGSARAAGIGISAKLLRLARSVRDR